VPWRNRAPALISLGYVGRNFLPTGIFDIETNQAAKCRCQASFVSVELAVSFKRAIFPEGRSTASGAYSPGIVVGDMVFVSGQGPFNPESNKYELLDIEHQTRLTLQSVDRVLNEANSSLDDAVMITVHLQNINEFARFDAVYEDLVPEPRPARTTVQSVLGGGISIEIDAIAIRGSGSIKSG
jgi:2-iminobutanoate/2-iminopropanoate deaminase